MRKAGVDAQQMAKLYNGTLPSTTGQGDTSLTQMLLFQPHLQGIYNLHERHGLGSGSG